MDIVNKFRHMDKYQLSEIKLICNMRNLNDLQASLNSRDDLREPALSLTLTVLAAALQTHNSKKDSEGITT